RIGRSDERSPALGDDPCEGASRGCATRRPDRARWRRRAGACRYLRRARAWARSPGALRRRTCSRRTARCRARGRPTTRESPTPGPASARLLRRAHLPEDGEHAVHVLRGAEEWVRRRFDLTTGAIEGGRYDHFVRRPPLEEGDVRWCVTLAQRGPVGV